MKTNKNRNIGSVSSATMRPEDLIPRFVDELRFQRPCHRQDRKLVKEIERRMRQEKYFDSEEASFDLEALFEALESYCLPYFYFGSHPGDGADYGYWLPEGFDQEFDGLKVSDISEVPKGFSGEVLQVNDHGNISLLAYSRGRFREIWSLV